jgi:hypothetical protein
MKILIRLRLPRPRAGCEGGGLTRCRNGLSTEEEDRYAKVMPRILDISSPATNQHTVAVSVTTSPYAVRPEIASLGYEDRALLRFQHLPLVLQWFQGVRLVFPKDMGLVR